MGEIIPPVPPEPCNDCLSGLPAQIYVLMIFPPVGTFQGYIPKTSGQTYQGEIYHAPGVYFNVIVIFCYGLSNSALIDSIVCTGIEIPHVGCEHFRGSTIFGCPFEVWVEPPI
jgi:hypothetical protein